jgi:maleamate amidohydrolase
MQNTSEFEDYCWKDIIPEHILEIYRVYERDLFIGKNSALVLIDLYNLVYLGGRKPVEEAFKENTSACGEQAWDAIAPTMALIDAFRRLKKPIIYVSYDDRPETDHQQMRASNRKKYEYEPDRYKIKEEFAPQPGDQFIYKKRASAFYGTPLASSLVQRGIDTVVVAGESTSGCVRATAVDSFSHGFHTVVVEECVFDRSLISHKVSLFDLHHKYADVYHLDRLLKELS